MAVMALKVHDLFDFINFSAAFKPAHLQHALLKLF